MDYNNHTYSVIEAKDFAKAKVEGFDLTVSDDGKWGFGDMGNDKASKNRATKLPPEAPQAVKDHFAVHGCLNHECMLALIKVMIAEHVNGFEEVL